MTGFEPGSSCIGRPLCQLGHNNYCPTILTTIFGQKSFIFVVPVRRSRRHPSSSRCRRPTCTRLRRCQCTRRLSRTATWRFCRRRQPYLLGPCRQRGSNLTPTIVETFWASLRERCTTLGKCLHMWRFCLSQHQRFSCNLSPNISCLKIRLWQTKSSIVVVAKNWFWNQFFEIAELLKIIETSQQTSSYRSLAGEKKTKLPC